MSLYQSKMMRNNMSYTTEHKRLEPVLQMCRVLDIATSPSPFALFESGSGGFQVYCTPQDNPGGDWLKVKDYMIAGAFAKPCAFLGEAAWHWEDETITGVDIGTYAYHLKDYLPTQYTLGSIHNRKDDLAWLKKKITKLFKDAGLEAPTFYTK